MNLRLHISKKLQTYSNIKPMMKRKLEKIQDHPVWQGRYSMPELDSLHPVSPRFCMCIGDSWQGW